MSISKKKALERIEELRIMLKEHWLDDYVQLSPDPTFVPENRVDYLYRAVDWILAKMEEDQSPVMGKFTSTTREKEDLLDEGVLEEKLHNIVLNKLHRKNERRLHNENERLVQALADCQGTIDEVLESLEGG